MCRLERGFAENGKDIFEGRIAGLEAGMADHRGGK
jgi:hypothetical protein